jgi:hypothetical protein
MKTSTKRPRRADVRTSSSFAQRLSSTRDAGERVARRGSTRVEEERPSGRWARGMIADER